MEKVSDGFKLFMSETDGVGEAFMGALFQLSDKSYLDKKTHELAYLSVLVATRYGGLPFHIEQAMRLGASEGNSQRHARASARRWHFGCRGTAVSG